MDNTHDDAVGASSHVNRRQFLSGAGAGAAVLGAGGLLAACGSTTSGSSTAKSSSAATGTPRRGGDLRVGLTAGGSNDSLSPFVQFTVPSLARSAQLYNALVGYSTSGELVNVLAEEITPNANATEWTVRVKPGIEFHNGKTLGAEDVIFTFQQATSPKVAAGVLPLLGPVEISGIRKLDARTVRIPCKAPYAALPQVIQQYNLPIIPVGFDVKNPVGSGPFKYVSFTPGQMSKFVRNPNYWETGLPYLDSVTITDYSDETSQVSALLANQEDGIGGISVGSVPSVSGGGKQIIYSNTGGIVPFTMRVDQPPFSDIRVRQAMRLIVNRTEMRQLVFGGHGLLGNDVTSPFDPAYAHFPQREQDIPQAKSLLKAAGHENLTIQIDTSDVGPGAVLSAQVLAQQAKAAGVTINVRNIPFSDFYGPNYLKYLFAQDLYFYSTYMLQVADAFLPTSTANETHFNNPQYNHLWAMANATPDASKRTPILQEMMHIDYTEGGYILPFFTPLIDAISPKLQGVLPAVTGQSLRSAEYKHMWFSA